MRAVAVFDLDGTITRTDTYLAFLLHTLRRRPQRAVHLASLSIAVTRFKLGRMSRDTLKSVFLTAIVGGCRRDEVDRLVEQFLPGCIRRTVKPAALARIAWHRARGHELILASASVDLYVGHVAEHFGFDRSVCTRTKWQNDRLTGALDGDNLLGDAKLAAVRAMVEADGARPEVYAYSDHHSDLPLLRYADHAYAIDPTPKLLAAAAPPITVERWLGPG